MVQTAIQTTRWALALAVAHAALTALTTAYARDVAPRDCADALTTQPHILPDDVAVFQKVADRHHLEITVMAPNPASLRYRARAGYAAKPAELKGCKTAYSGAIEGLVHCPESHFRTHAEWARNKAELFAKGYEVLGPDRGYLVRRIEDGKYFFSDYDLFSVRDLDTGRPAFDEALRTEINDGLGRRLVRHGPLEDYSLRNTIPIKIPILVIAPRRAPVVIETRAELEREFSARDLPRW